WAVGDDDRMWCEVDNFHSSSLLPYTVSIAFLVMSQVFPDFFTWPFSIYSLSLPWVQDALTVPGCKPHFSSASLAVNTSVSGTSRSGSTDIEFPLLQGRTDRQPSISSLDEAHPPLHMPKRPFSPQFPR